MKKILSIVALGALGALVAVPATARAVVAWSGNMPAALAVAAPSPASLALMAGMQGPGAATAGGIAPLGSAGELVAWAKLQDHLKRVETVWGTPYHQNEHGEVVPDPDAPPKYFIVRTFDSHYDYAPPGEPLLGHAAIRFADSWGNSWLAPLVPLGQNFFWTQLQSPALIPWETISLEALAWHPGDDATDPNTAYYRSPLLGL